MKKLNIRDEIKNLEVQTRRKEKKNKEKINWKWVITIVIVAFTLSFLLSFVAQTFIPNFSLTLGIIITAIFILLGVLFDIIGVAVTASSEKVFHSMNSRKVRGANIAVKFKKNADKVSSFCCDVVGDVCGVISGTAAATIAILLSDKIGTNVFITTLTVTGIISALTIGGKAMGKSFAMNKSNIILYEFAKFISYFYRAK